MAPQARGRRHHYECGRIETGHLLPRRQRRPGGGAGACELRARTSRLQIVGDWRLQVAGQERGQVDLVEDEPPTRRGQAWRPSMVLAPLILASNLLPPSRDETALLSLLSAWSDKLGGEMRVDQRGDRRIVDSPRRLGRDLVECEVRL